MTGSKQQDTIQQTDTSIIPSWKDCLCVWWEFIKQEKAIVLLFVAVMSCILLIPFFIPIKKLPIDIVVIIITFVLSIPVLWALKSFPVWVFTVVFLRNPYKYLGTGSDKTYTAFDHSLSLSVRSFFRWLGQICLAEIVVFLPIMLFFIHARLWTFILSLSLAVVSVLLFYAFMLVSPIAASKKGFALRESYRMTYGYKWKICWNHLILMVILTLSAFGILFGVSYMLGGVSIFFGDSHILADSKVLLVIARSATYILTLAATSIYSCMIYMAIRGNSDRKNMNI